MLRDMGIAHVYDSRSTEFADLIRPDTDEYGVDIVLNSLPGPHNGPGWNCSPSADDSSNRQTRRLRQQPVGCPLPSQPRVLLRRSRANGVSHPQRVGELLANVYQLVAHRECRAAKHHYPLAMPPTPSG